MSVNPNSIASALDCGADAGNSLADDPSAESLRGLVLRFSRTYRPHPGAAVDVHRARSSTRFEAVDARTRLWLREVYPSVEARDAAMASGMEYGIKAGYERLDEIVAR
jgi:hypothetical protein